MLHLSADGMDGSIVSAVDLFCRFAFSQTLFPETFINFKPFDSSGVVNGLLSVQDGNLHVNYNISKNDSLQKILEVLAHESIHAKQMSDGRLKYALVRTPKGIEWGFEWEGKVYRAPETAEEIIRLPWEIEAYANTESMLILYNLMDKSRLRNVLV